MIAVLVNGRAVMISRKYSRSLSDISMLTGKGVEFRVCNNSMQHFGLDKADIPEFAGIVASGAGELARREHKG
jgi:Uncharacterized conserved protein